MKRFSWLFIVDFVYLISAQYGQYIELSPCPSNFEYATDGNSVYGIIHLWPDGPVRVLFLRANFTISGRLNPMESSLQPIGSDVLRDYNRGKRISFRVIFPQTSSLPMLTALTVNDRTICVGPGDRPSPTNYVTTITLQNLLYLKPNGLSGFSSQYQPNFQVPKPTEKYEIISIHKLNNTDLINIPNDSSFTNNPQKPEVIIYENEDQFIQSVLNQQTKPTQKVPGQQNRPTTQQTPTFEFDLIPIYQSPNKVTTQRIPLDKNEGISQFNPPNPQYRPEYPDEQIPATPATTKAPQTTAAPVVVDRVPDITTRRPSELSNNIQCGISASDNTRVPLIYNGESFERGDWPWLVAMYKRKDGGLSFICSGTLVSDRHVITAAHCMRTKTTLLRITDIVVKVGVYNLEDWGDDEFITRTLASATIHESYNASTLANDILVITFDRRVQFSNSIRPACLWTGSSDLNKVVGTAGVVTGWGQSELSGAGRGEPRMVRMPIVSTAKCRASKPDFHKLTSAYTLCAGDRNGAGPCLGDSGAGLYLRDSGLWRLRGIVSLSLRAETGDSSCNLNEYIVFTDAAQYLAWIQYIMNT